MKRRRQCVVAVMFCTLLVLACGRKAPKSITIVEEDVGKTIQVSTDDNVSVVLKGNPSTGYIWDVAAVDSAILKLSSEPTFKADSNAIGSGGQLTFSFKVIGRGQTTLLLIYHRRFEKDQPPLKTFEVTIATD